MPVASHRGVASVTNVFEKLCSNSEVPAFRVFSDRSNWQGICSDTGALNLGAAALVTIGLNINLL